MQHSPNLHSNNCSKCTQADIGEEAPLEVCSDCKICVGLCSAGDVMKHVLLLATLHARNKSRQVSDSASAWRDLAKMRLLFGVTLWTFCPSFAVYFRFDVLLLNDSMFMKCNLLKGLVVCSTFVCGFTLNPGTSAMEGVNLFYTALSRATTFGHDDVNQSAIYFAGNIHRLLVTLIGHRHSEYINVKRR